MLLGVAVLGGEEIVSRLVRRVREVEITPDPVIIDEPAEEETNLDYLRYLGIGLFSRSQNLLGRGLRRGYYASLGFSSWLVNRVDRSTDNRLLRPFRQPVEARIRRLGRELSFIIREGRQEEHNARQLAKETVTSSIEEVLDYVSHSPELAEMIRGQVSQQSSTLAGEVRDRTRRRTLRADDFSERFFRRLFRLTPREQLPPSPLEGEALNGVPLNEDEV